MSAARPNLKAERKCAGMSLWKYRQAGGCLYCYRVSSEWDARLDVVYSSADSSSAAEWLMTLRDFSARLIGKLMSRKVTLPSASPANIGLE